MKCFTRCSCCGRCCRGSCRHFNTNQCVDTDTQRCHHCWNNYHCRDNFQDLWCWPCSFFRLWLFRTLKIKQRNSRFSFWLDSLEQMIRWHINIIRRNDGHGIFRLITIIRYPVLLRCVSSKILWILWFDIIILVFCSIIEWDDLK